MRRIIFGIGDFAEVLYYKLVIDGIKVDAFSVDDEYVTEESFLDKPVIAYSKLKEYYKNEEIGLYLAIIGKNCMFELRKLAFERLVRDGYEICNYISSAANIQAMDIGKGNIIMENVVIEGHCSIGNGNIIWPGVVMPHHNKIGSFNNISPSASFSGYSSIEDQCFIGNNAVLNNRIVVHSKGLVGAGVYAQRDVPAEKVMVAERSYILNNRNSWEFK